MTDRENVIKALEEAIQHYERYSGDEYGREYDFARVEVETLEDAIVLLKEDERAIKHQSEHLDALLKAQEPRVMTLEEVKMLDRDYYYLEAMRSPGKELREIVGAYGLTCVTWPSITWARQTMGDGGYGKTWRCWTSRPTDEQREATPWN